MCACVRVCVCERVRVCARACMRAYRSTCSPASGILESVAGAPAWRQSCRTMSSATARGEAPGPQGGQEPQQGREAPCDERHQQWRRPGTRWPSSRAVKIHERAVKGAAIRVGGGGADLRASGRNVDQSETLPVEFHGGRPEAQLEGAPPVAVSV